jgi:serine/threonine protein kinase
MLDCLCELHLRGYVHKSVKPENFCFVCPTTVGSDLRGPPSHGRRRLLKLIDFGRSLPLDVSHAARDRPFTGWWYSINGHLGRPQGPKDDLVSLLYSLGFLLDDALMSVQDAAHPSQDRRQTFLRIRRNAVRQAAAALRAARREWTSTHAGTPSDRTHHHHSRCQWVADRAIKALLSSAFADMPNLLKTTSLPEWYIALLQEAERLLLDPAATSESLAAHIRRVLQQQLAVWRATVEEVGDLEASVIDVVRRYITRRKRQRSESRASNEGHSK